MATATRQRSRASLVKPENIGSAITFLQELPEKPKEDLSLKAAVGQMQQSIRETLAKGYSYDDIAKMLSEKGIVISALTLKNYVPSGKRQTSKAKAKRTKKSSEKAAETVKEMTNGSAASKSAESTPELTVEVPASAKPKRGRTKAAAKTTTESKTTTKPARGRKPAAAKKETATSPARKRRQSKAAS